MAGLVSLYMAVACNLFGDDVRRWYYGIFFSAVANRDAQASLAIAGLVNRES